MKTPQDSPALKERSENYPPCWRDRVPLRVKMAKTVCSEMPFLPSIEAKIGQEYDVWVNSHGALSAISAWA